MDHFMSGLWSVDLERFYCISIFINLCVYILKNTFIIYHLGCLACVFLLFHTYQSHLRSYPEGRQFATIPIHGDLVYYLFNWKTSQWQISGLFPLENQITIPLQRNITMPLTGHWLWCLPAEVVKCVGWDIALSLTFCSLFICVNMYYKEA